MADLMTAQAAVAATEEAPPPSAPTPAEELTALVVWGASLFYLAESGVNPMVRSYWDALHYVATSLSVGYANVFPVTGLGKAIGSVVMMVGPALSARALDQTPRAAGDGDNNAAIVARLDAILAELRRNET
jgi:hypothetical protein